MARQQHFMFNTKEMGWLVSWLHEEGHASVRPLSRQGQATAALLQWMSTA